MDYRFELYDVANATKQANLTVTSARETEALAGEHTMQLDIDPLDATGIAYLGLINESTPATIHAQKYIRRTSATTGERNDFIVRSVTRKRDNKNKIVIAVDCEHSKYKMLNRVVRIEQSYSQINATEFLNLVIPYASGFTIAENQIPTTIYRDVEINYPTVMGALKYLCDTFTQFDGTYERKFYYTVDYSGNVRIRREDSLGILSPYPLMVNHNLSDIADKRDDSTLVNRILYSGLGNSIGFADNVTIVDTSGSAGGVTYLSGFIAVTETFTLNDAGGNTNPVAWESFVLIKLNSIFSGTWASGSGSFIVSANLELLDASNNVVFSQAVKFGEVTYPNRAIGNPKWYRLYLGKNQTAYKVRYTTTGVAFLNGANPTIIAVQKTSLQYELAPNRDYVEDVAAQGPYGVVEAPIENREHPKVLNLVRSWKNQGAALQVFDATLSGTYTSGLCNMFRIIGSGVTRNENTDRAYIINGTRSQRIFPNTLPALEEGAGLAVQFPNLVEGSTYHFIANLYVASGNVDVKVWAGYPSGGGVGSELFKIQTLGVGWIQVASVTGFGLPVGSGAFPFDITFTTTNRANFYIDSFTLARSDEPIAFYKDNSANVLKDKAQRLLRINASPRTSYEVTAKDLAQVDDYYRFATLNVGDDVMLKDNLMNVGTQVKIFRKDSDLFDPTKLRLVLGDRSVGAAEYINVLAGAKNLRGI